MQIIGANPSSNGENTLYEVINLPAELLRVTANFMKDLPINT
jgi:hypothetical protein